MLISSYRSVFNSIILMFYFKGGRIYFSIALIQSHHNNKQLKCKHQHIHIAACVMAANTCDLSPTAQNACGPAQTLSTLLSVIHTSADQRVL